MSNTLLVTGGAGFIGANFVHYWLETYPEDTLIVLDALTYAGNMANLAPVSANPRFTFVHADIGDQKRVEQLLRDKAVNTLVHFAAESHVDRSISGPDAFLETNIIGTHSLLKAARQVWLTEQRCVDKHRFHHISTDEVYGTLSASDPAFKESTPYAPNSPYSASKAASDHLVRAYHHTYGLSVSTSNCSNNYGPFHFPEKLIPLVITNILFDKALPIYGDGKQIRDWLYVRDHARGIDLVLKNGKPGETYNIGGINEWTNIDIVNKICQLMDEAFARDSQLAEKYPDAKSAIAGKSSDLIAHVADRPGHDQRYAIDPTKAKQALNYQPEESFESGIRLTLQWYLENDQWWRKVMNGSYKDWIAEQYQSA